MRILIVFIVLLSLFACKKEPTAQQVVDRAIEYSGGEKFDNSRISFEFRDRIYQIDRTADRWVMERVFNDSLGQITDRYDEEGFQRYLNGSAIEVPDSMAFKYIESINSVIYFALLPYKLNDAAVQKELLGKDTLDDKTYYKLKVSFLEEGGGVDHEDDFMYWFHSKNYSLDYLAYSFQVNGGGLRFRKAYNERFIDGIRMVDYVNYAPSKEANLQLIELSGAYKKGELDELSRIELQEIYVN